MLTYLSIICNVYLLSYFIAFTAFIIIRHEEVNKTNNLLPRNATETRDFRNCESEREYKRYLQVNYSSAWELSSITLYSWAKSTIRYRIYLSIYSVMIVKCEKSPPPVCNSIDCSSCYSHLDIDSSNDNTSNSICK